MIDQIGQIDWLGWIVFTIVEGSLFFVLLAAIFGRPWKPKVTLTFFVTLLTLVAAFVVITWLGGLIFAVFIP